MIGARTRWAAVWGDPVDHSASPALHNAAFAALGIDAIFLAMQVPADRLADAVAGARALRPLGLSVTVPHKRAIAGLVDALAPPADRIGAVNCIEVRDDGGLIGHNTDAGGFADAVGDVRGARAVVLGAGGAARAVAAGLADAGAADVTVIARRPDRVDWTAARPWTAAELARLAPAADLWVDCTSAALSADRESAVPAPVPVDALAAHATVASLVYHRVPALLAAARARGLRTVDGRAMLLHQGARALRIWTGRQPPLDAMRAALDAALGPAGS